VQDEELNVLWWLHGGHSELAKVPFGELPVAQRPLVLAAELSDLSTILPGPPSLAALLSRAGRRTKRSDVGRSSRGRFAGAAAEGAPAGL
jgi:hypothetical protein